MFESKINRGRANGYASLDSSGLVPTSSLPPIQSTIDTGSFATTSSLQSLVNATGSFATTGSNQFSGSQVITGSLTVTSTVINDSSLHLTGSDLTIDSGSLRISGGVYVSGSVTVSSTVINNATIYTTGSDLIIDSGSLVVTGSVYITGSIYADNLTGVISSSAQITEFGFTSSSINNLATTGSNTFVGNQIISGAVGTTGTLTVQNVITTPSGQYFAAYSDTSTELSWQALFTPNSAVYSGIGSSLAGTTITNTSTDGNGDALPTETWSFNMDGTLNVPGDITGAANLATTGSNIYTGNQIISGSLTVSGSISGGGIVTSSNISTIQTITSASYAGITPVSGTLYIIIG